MNWTNDASEKLVRSAKPDCEQRQEEPVRRVVYQDILHLQKSDCKQRQAPRLYGQLSLRFSGMDARDIVINTGTAFDLCEGGIGLRTECSLEIGMVLALIIESPGSEEDICIPEARVAWVKENLAGLSIRSMKSEDWHRLQRAFSATCLQLQA